MMRTMRALAAALALTGATTAVADTFTPPSSTAVFTGNVLLNASPPLVCTVSVTIVSNAAGSDAWVATGGIGGGGLCGLFSFSGLPWNINVETPLPPPTGQPATQLRFTGVRVVGGVVCGPGDLIATWTPGSPPTITFPPGTMLLPGPCPFQGVLTQTSGAPLAITN
ncbi:hypothetical protein [Caulobacter mirabilis]|uniref:Protein activator of alkane oxidation PraB n=1 Tax=Caulobacter mirabilis TaxID=69666 RepID=A0A2D2AWB8_9CAUL|nr:hypothetical protein [Caulobacter mirabilis]ATQ42265.1 hypothetical protein CSW64_07455 [Caulobacter mirabilis]